ncbi:8-oxoguanine DNA glycosylase [Phanerochaete sordida]|uniref:DNA-(apurinic or apyrimidinic site) lyase n=1 Tax=Phanerochaete sordida TaxID=48140 RepID=A0A9P3LED8_9APHY|nr:8-oxoguanine DNA glycosylase [Phanerochaete sordida]
MAAAAALTAGFRKLPLPLAQLSLAAVLQCGQSFRWSIFPLTRCAPDTAADATTPSHEYRFCLKDRVVCLRQTPDALYYRSVCPTSLKPLDDDTREAQTLSWIRDYFQLDVDLLQLYEEWSDRDPVFRKLRHRFSGIRLLRQDPFECLLSFICSSNNNIKRISKMVKALCTEYTPALLSLPPPDEAEGELGVEAYHPFPPPSVLSAPEVAANLRKLGFGYRADFIQKTAKMLVDAHGSPSVAGTRPEPAEEWLSKLRAMTTADARIELLKLMGVGRKVADCVLLMSMDKPEVVPVDTHVHDIAKKYYGVAGSKAKTNMTPQLYDMVNTKLVNVWGTYAGWAQSVLFTSDLKAFASYGLDSPVPSDSTTAVATPTGSLPATPMQSPSPSKRKRGKKVAVQEETVAVTAAVFERLSATEGAVEVEYFTLAERVKRRRRGP